jgi:3-dehydroquinate dehydratase/shikimate dehydrogenase
MGEVGTPSRILAAKFGAPFTYSTFHHERALAPGQLSFRQMQDVYRYDSINTDTKVFGVIADPIAHNLGPIVHNAAFGNDELNALYVPFRVPVEHLEQFLTDCRGLGISGLSVGFPHKEAAIQYCTKVDGAAQAIGAVNTLIFKGAETHGFNTEYRAAMFSLDAVLPSAASSAPLTARTALILGSGGAARAMAFGVKRRGANVIVAGRILA